jgi:hypothetical protein
MVASTASRHLVILLALTAVPPALAAPGYVVKQRYGNPSTR